MNCDECKEQVFELIEREAFDPEGVREALDRCPDCRALFDQMKAALSRAEQLPIEEPPAEVDAAILRAARTRSPKVVPLQRRWFQASQWAVAAVALLAVGVGVWAIPREPSVGETGEPVAMERAAQVEAEAFRDEEAPVAAPASELAAADDVGTSQPATPAARQRVAAKSTAARSQHARVKRKARADVDSHLGAETVAAPAAAPGLAAGNAAGARVDMATLEEDARGSEAKEEAQELSPECAKRLAKLERRRADAKTTKVDPEDALAIGRCYQAAGNIPEARAWLERAASHPKTKERARRALEGLPAD